MRQIKLITGQMNITYITFKANYAEGVRRPKKPVKQETRVIVTKTRKNEKLVA